MTKNDFILNCLIHFFIRYSLIPCMSFMNKNCFKNREIIEIIDSDHVFLSFLFFLSFFVTKINHFNKFNIDFFYVTKRFLSEFFSFFLMPIFKIIENNIFTISNFNNNQCKWFLLNDYFNKWFMYFIFRIERISNSYDSFRFGNRLIYSVLDDLNNRKTGFWETSLCSRLANSVDGSYFTSWFIVWWVSLPFSTYNLIVKFNH